MLAITDHDTIAGYLAAAEAPDDGPKLVAGIEFSTTWAGRSIHVLGLNVDAESPELQHGVSKQQAVRGSRAREIASRLTRLGIDDPYDAVREAAGTAGIGRPHFAAHLVESGVVKDVATAFRKYLGAGKPGDVKHGWADLDQVIAWIRAAGGDPVLAHPAKYKLTSTKLRLLIADFVEAGGTGIEVVCGQQSRDTTRRLAEIAKSFDLAASIGSDFHHPDLAWSQPGCCGDLPEDLRAVWQSW